MAKQLWAQVSLSSQKLGSIEPRQNLQDVDHMETSGAASKYFDFDAPNRLTENVIVGSTGSGIFSLGWSVKFEQS